MKDLENWYIYVFAIDRGVFTPPLLTKNHNKFYPLYKFKN